MSTALLAFGVLAIAAFLAVLARIARRPYLVQVHLHADQRPHSGEPPSMQALRDAPNVVQGKPLERREARCELSTVRRDAA